MRNIILAATIIFFSSCSEDFLDRKPTGTLTAETFFENEEHAILATNAGPTTACRIDHTIPWKLAARCRMPRQRPAR